MKKEDFNKRYASFLHEQKKIKEAKQIKKIIDEEEMYLKSFMKDVLPLMTVRDLVGCLVMKICDNEGAILKGIAYKGNVYEVTIKKEKKED